MPMSPRQCRIARAALGLSVRELGEIAQVRAATISHFESGGDSYRSTVDKLQLALEARGVVFIGKGETSLAGGEGVRLREA
jgi:transcriptional regulator with XRE-family HTH domain